MRAGNLGGLTAAHQPDRDDGFVGYCVGICAAQQGGFEVNNISRLGMID